MKIFKYLLVFAFGWMALSCEDIIEKDINDEIVVLIAPAEGIASEYFDITFYWEPVVGASHYRFQLTTPSFESPVTFLMDSLVSLNSITLTLDSGSYGWRVRGENGSYATAYTTQQFNVVGSSDLSKQRLRIISPLNNTYSNKTEILFKWEPVLLADKYILTIESDKLLELLVYGTEHKMVVDKKDMNAKWSVTAINEKSVLMSDTYNLFMDFTPPLGPRLVGPVNDTTFIGFPVTLKWEWEEEGLLRDSLFIFDHLGSVISSFPRPMESKLFIISSGLLPGKGVFSWGVKSVDKAGNVSADFVETWKFTYQ
jgi:hypothetical protein